MRATLLGLALLLWASFAQAEVIYVEENGALTKLNADPGTLKPAEWQVRLYPEGVSPTGPNYWGLITGKSAASVNQQLASDQRFERQWRRFCGCSSRNSPFNPLGPIAVMSKAKGSHGLFIDKYISMLRDAVASAEAAARDLDTARNPYKGLGAATLDYGKVVADGIRLTRQSMRAVFLHDVAVLQHLQSELDKWPSSLQGARKALDVARSTSGARSSVSRNGMCDGKPMLPGERCCVDNADPDIFMVCVPNVACPPMPNMRCDP